MTQPSQHQSQLNISKSHVQQVDPSLLLQLAKLFNIDLPKNQIGN